MPICPKCLKASIDGMTHTSCKTALGLDGLYSIWPYEKVVRKTILKLKYNFAFDIAGELAQKAMGNISNWLIPHGLKNIVLVPIPVHPMRRNWRGFNQTEIIGKEISRRMVWKYAPKLLVRNKLVVPQTVLKGDERKKNIKGAFSFNDKYKKNTFGNYSCVIFDDVWTTGSTVKEACKVLKRKKFKNVWALTLAKSLGRFGRGD